MKIENQMGRSPYWRFYMTGNKCAEVGFSLRGGYSFPRKKGWGRVLRLAATWIRTPTRSAKAGWRDRAAPWEWQFTWLWVPGRRVGPCLTGCRRAGGGLQGKGFLRLVPRGQWFSKGRARGGKTWLKVVPGVLAQAGEHWVRGAGWWPGCILNAFAIWLC